MSNKDRRKQLRHRYISSYIAPAKRAANKVEDGKSVRPLTPAERRYIHRMNQYYGTEAGSWLHPPELRA
jgi:predicted RNA-binding protein Jag